jgi:hypothetical protein
MRLAIAAVVVAFASCKTATTAQKTAAQPAVVIYKTKADYSKLVPVTLSDDRSQIVSYPHPSDVKIGERYAYPTALNKGYLLDNRGIGKTVAFLKLTYAEYAALPEAPSLADMDKMIVDKDPLTELYDCGSSSKYTNIEKELNAIIGKGQLSEQCKQIK